MKQLRILQITSGFRKGVSGGIAAVVTNYCTSSNFENDFHIDFLALGYQPFEPYRQKIESKNYFLKSLGIHSNGYKRLIDIVIYLKQYLYKNKYDIVHINSGAITQVFAASIAAKLAGCNIVIVHSHNALIKSKYKESFFYIIKFLFNYTADYFFACSELAARSMFANSIIRKKKWIFIPNAIDTNRFDFDSTVRTRYRKELNLENTYVLGNVGRFNEQKNHLFLLEVFSEVVKYNERARLLLIGTGELELEIKKRAQELGVLEKIRFTGQRKDVNLLLQAMDVFVFPSKWEGLPVSVVEAQASGLRCLLSDSITREVKCSDLVDYLELDRDIWVNAIIHNCDVSYSRENCIKKTKFDIDITGKNLADLYLRIYEKSKG